MKFWKLKLDKVIFALILISFALTAAYVAVMIIIGPPEAMSYDTAERERGDLVLSFVQCILGIFAMLLPGLLEHRVNLVVPSRMMLLYALFLFGSIYLGEIRHFYYAIPFWDVILHTMSGGMLSTLGFSIIVLLNRTDRIPVNLSPMFIALFTFCFSVTLGVFWEIYEFTADSMFNLNMQVYSLEDGTPLIGRMALADTMQDLIIDSISASVISCIGYLSLKYQKGWIERVLLKKNYTRSPSQKKYTNR